MSSNNPYGTFANFGRFRPSSNNIQPSSKRRISPLQGTIAIIIALVIIIGLSASVWAEIAWYAQMERIGIIFTNWGSRAAIFMIAMLTTAAAIGINLWFVGRTQAGRKWQVKKQKKAKIQQSRPDDEMRYLDEDLKNLGASPKITLDAQAQLAGLIRPFRRALLVLIPLGIGLFIAVPVQSNWQVFAAWTQAQPFGKSDPIFGMDVSFFIFSLPAWQGIVSLTFDIMVACLVVSAVAYYIQGDISLARFSATRQTRIHISVLLSLLSLLFAARYFLSRYWLLLGEHDKFSGASYTDIHAVLPARNILVGISLAVGVMFLVGAFRRRWILPVTGVGLMLASAVLVGGVYPWLVQRFQVDPSAQELEAPYIKHNIDATRDAFGIADVKEQTYAAKTEATAGQLRSDAKSTASIRLLDPSVVSRTFGQLEQNRQYYRFSQNLTVDRYEIDGKIQDTVIAVRELDPSQLGESQKSWVNQHTVFTHGFGVVAAYGSKVNTDGSPDFWEHGIPSQGALGKYEPRIYFGRYSPEYSIVGGTKDGNKQEFDYPADNEKDRQVNNTYDGNGGPSIGNAWQRLMYALHFRSSEVFFSKQVNSNSQVLFHRDPVDRVQRSAPYLTLDSKPYPAVVDMDGNPDTPKRVVWIVDGYTTSDSYPYSRSELLSQATADSLNQSRFFGSDSSVNYMRNSVKAVVDAYDGSVTLYQWDAKDPVLATWAKVFPGQIHPMSEIPGDLMSHLRYPEDMFKVQRNLIARYHTTDPKAFYSASDFWKLPDDPTHEDSTSIAQFQPPYYLTMQAPGQTSAEFSLYSTYIPYGQSDRNVLTGYLTVDSETGSQPGKVREGYGKMRLLSLPSDLAVPGPGQVSNKFKTTDEVSRTLNLLNQTSTEVVRGNLLTLPVGGGLLYVQPVYVKGKSGTTYPLLRFVLTSFGDKIGFAPSLQGSLDQLFGGDSGAVTSEHPDVKGSTGSEQPGNIPTPKLSVEEQLKKALEEASAAMKAGNDALTRQDWAAYGQQQKLLNQALERALSLQGQPLIDESGAGNKTENQQAPQSSDAAQASNASLSSENFSLALSKR